MLHLPRSKTATQYLWMGMSHFCLLVSHTYNNFHTIGIRRIRSTRRLSALLACNWFNENAVEEHVIRVEESRETKTCRTGSKRSQRAESEEQETCLKIKGTQICRLITCDMITYPSLEEIEVGFTCVTIDVILFFVGQYHFVFSH